MSTVRILGILLAVQALLVAVTWWPSDRSAYVPRPWLEVDVADIDGVEIAARPGENEDLAWLALARDGERWTIASKDGYPADTAKVNQLLERLSGMRVRSPIATSAPTHNALKVGEREYGRRVRVRAGDVEREFVVGAAKSESVHVRFAEEDDVYEASPISEFSLSDSAAAYWEADYVSVPAAEITSFSVENESGTVFAQRLEDGWSIADLPEGAVVDGAAIDAFLGEVTRLRLAEPVARETRPDQGLDAGVRISWTLEAEDESVGGGYAVGAESGANVYVKSDTSPWVVLVAATSVEPVRTASPERFTTAAPSAPAQAE